MQPDRGMRIGSSRRAGKYLCLAMSVQTCVKNLATVCSAFTVFTEDTCTSSTASAGTRYHQDACSKESVDVCTHCQPF